jgi:hypothetical protein
LAAKKSKKKQKKLIFTIIAIILLAALCISIVLISQHKSGLPIQPPHPSSDFKQLDKPQNNTLYMDLINQRNITSPLQRINGGMNQSQIGNRTVIPLISANAGFEYNTQSIGYGEGALQYSNESCFKGKRCVHIDADNKTGYGVVILNSEEINIKPNRIYNATLNINCMKCDGNGAYMGIFFLKKNNNLSKIPYAFIESKRFITVLNSTKGYELVSLIAEAPDDSVKAVYGIRVHTELAMIVNETELYVDDY